MLKPNQHGDESLGAVPGSASVLAAGVRAAGASVRKLTLRFRAGERTYFPRSNSPPSASVPSGSSSR